MILPRLLPQQFGDQSVRHSLLTDPCLSAGVREYVPGDPLHRMHWKASAHAGTLLMRREEHTAQQTVTVLLALESHSPDSGIMTQDEALLEHTIRVCAQCLWEFFRNGWQVRLCIGERRKDGLPIMSPYGGGSGMPCGACREFFLQLSEKNRNMEILVDFETRETVRLESLVPNWWGWERYEQAKKA